MKLAMENLKVRVTSFGKVKLINDWMVRSLRTVFQTVISLIDVR